MFINFLFKILILLGFFSGGFGYSSAFLQTPSLSQDFSLTASKAAVFSEDLNSFVFSKDIDEPQSIASITKLMSAIVFLESNPDLDSVYKIKAADKVEGGKINLFLGEELLLKDLLYTSLVASDNGATTALVGAMNLDQDEFVQRMNAKAREMSLLNTEFFDPSGLNPKNISTAREVIKIFLEALRHDEIREAVSLTAYKYFTIQGREKDIKSTDSYLLSDNDEEISAFGGKTGFIDEAGYCFVGMFTDLNYNNYYAVVLNSENKNSRFLESKNLVKFFGKRYE